MPPPLWDKNLLLNANEFMSAVCFVFGLNRTAFTNFDMEVVIEKIKGNKFANDERGRLATVPTLAQKDLQSLHKCLPRSWVDLATALHNHFNLDLTAKATEALKRSRVSPTPPLQDVIDQAENLLFWLILKDALVLVDMIENSGLHNMWLDERAIAAVERFANPSRIFRDWARLLAVGNAWEQYRVKNDLPVATACPVERIKKKRGEVPLPKIIEDFEKDLNDRDLARDLHAPMEATLWQALRYWPLINIGCTPPEFDLVRARLLEKLTWQAIKNGKKYYDDKKTTTWLTRLLVRKKLFILCIQVINMEDGRAANSGIIPNDEEMPEQAPPARAANRRSQRDQLHAAIDMMPAAKEQEKKVLKMYLELTRDDNNNPARVSEANAVSEIARELNITEEQVGEKIAEAKKWLVANL